MITIYVSYFSFRQPGKLQIKNKSAIYTTWNVSHQPITGEKCCIPPQGSKSSYIIGLLIILSQISAKTDQTTKSNTHHKQPNPTEGRYYIDRPSTGQGTKYNGTRTIQDLKVAQIPILQ